jgi:hypothetical protein
MLLPGLAAIMCACGNGSNTGKPAALPAPGTVVATAAIPISDDSLNKRSFSVTIAADSAIANGTYSIVAIYGFDTARGMMTMPHGLNDYKIVIKKGNDSHTWLVGFLQPDDTTFNDYLEVTGMRNTITMHYLKSYTFEQ